jgi:hypothetical protein
LNCRRLISDVDKNQAPLSAGLLFMINQRLEPVEIRAITDWVNAGAPDN